MTSEPDYYARLGIMRDASTDDVRRAYREAARRLHPDTNTEPGATELFLGVQQAYEILSDSEKRHLYDLTLPESGEQRDAVTISPLFSRSSLPKISEPQLMYTLIEMVAPPGTQGMTSPPLNVCMVLDCSTSMQGILLDVVKATAIELVRQLKPQDILSIVVFSDRAEVLLAAGDRFEISKIETGIRMLQSHGGTEIFQGLDMGFAQVRRYRSPKYVNHMVLLTDGRTYGDEQLCLQLARDAVQDGIGISALGIGNKWNDEFLDKLTASTGGSCMYVSQPKEIQFFLKEKFRGMGGSYADSIAFNFETGPGVKLRYAFRLQPEASPLETNTPLRIGQLPYDSALKLLLEFSVDSVKGDVRQVTLASGRAVMNIPSRSLVNYSVRLDLTRPVAEEPSQTPPPQAIVHAMSRLTLYRMQERARQDVSQGKIREATRHLQNIATHLIAQGKRDLAHSILVEAEHIQSHQSYSESGEKRIKYGTRGLLLPANIEDK